MSTIAIVGTAISAVIVLGIVIALSAIDRKLTPPAPEIAADPDRVKLPAPTEDELLDE